MKPMESCKTLFDVANEIGGFERWTDLPPELKTLVVGHLDYKTRTRLSLCSMHDYEVVSSSPIQICRIEIKDIADSYFRRNRDPTENVSVQMEFEDDEHIHLYFEKRENATEISWITQRQNPTLKFIRLEGCDYLEEAVKFVEKRLKQSRYNVKSMSVEMENWPLDRSGIQFLPRCEKIRICSKNESMFRWWLERVDPNLKSLQLSSRFSGTHLSSEILAMDHFKMCDRLCIWGGESNFTDEQFLSLSAFRFTIDSRTITDKAINTFIHKWIDGEAPNDFQHFHIWTTREKVKNEILKNVAFRPWDDEFRSEAFCLANEWKQIMREGDCYQINKRDGSGFSATLSIGYDSVIFSVTGRQFNHNGRIHKIYNIPRTL